MDIGSCCHQYCITIFLFSSTWWLIPFWSCNITKALALWQY